MGGSSPLARGLLTGESIKFDFEGIIPARAGFTHISCRRRRGSWDHPRSRGVYLPSATTQPEFWGSSPLARGLRLSRGEILGKTGIIPARAGFTTPGSESSSRFQDHPRSRGVYTYK